MEISSQTGHNIKIQNMQRMVFMLTRESFILSLLKAFLISLALRMGSAFSIHSVAAEPFCLKVT